jgi:hypothetical protein
VIAERTVELAAFWAETFGPDAEPTGNRSSSGPSAFSDDEVIARARAAANGAKFMRLWAGDTTAYGGDDSAADLALLSILSFWTQDADQLNRLFRRSGLYREKWERNDYRLRTINKALQRDGTYEPPTRLITPGLSGASTSAHADQSLSTGRNGASANADFGVDSQTSTITDVVQVYRKWLSLPGDDEGPIYVSLGAVAANLLATDPVWLLIVGSSSGGKTELINPIAGLPYVHLAATLTEASLLSGTPRREKATDSKGGLLRDIGEFGILALKDFTSILAMNRDQRGQLLAALREIFDGSWTRHVGVDGGKTLAWSGKLGLIAGCTAAIDSHHGVMSVMGERFLLYRLPAIDPAKQAERALANAGQERHMREELATAVRGLFAGLAIGEGLPPIDERETAGLIALSSLVASARSAVERDSYKREIELILDTEAPARLAQTLRRLYAGLLTIGLDRATAWPLVCKVGLDCIPKLRRSAFDVLLNVDEWRSTTDVAAAAKYPTTTARRALEDMAAHGVIDRMAGGSGKPDQWRLANVARDRYTATFPDLSGADVTDGDTSFKNSHRTYDDFSGTVPNSPPPCGESEQTRVRRCWSCKAVVDESDPCPSCGWSTCACGTCSPECSAATDREQAGVAADDPWTWR